MIENAEQIGTRLWRFLALLSNRFCAHRGLDSAATLSYTTLLSIVPLMTVILAVLSAFPIADRLIDALQDFIFQNFVPTSGEVIEQYLNEFAANAARLTGASFMLLILVAFLMMHDIDRSLNAIWETRAKRGTVSKFLIYWALLSLGPVLVALSLAATSYLITLPFLVEAEETLGIGQQLIRIAPVVTSAMAFTLMYLVIPNRRVRVRDALVGGLIAALLFEIAKRAFGYYVTNFPNYEAIYGTLAVIPIFLVWLYLSWIIFLLGAELTHCLDLYRHCSNEKRLSKEGLPQVLDLLSLFHQAQHEGKLLALDDMSDREQSGLGPYQIENLLTMLSKSGLIVQTEKDDWVLLKDLHELTLYELLMQLELPLPASDESTSAFDWNQKVTPILGDARMKLHDCLDVPLGELFHSNNPE